jgi:CBS domain-containing protein
VAPSSPSAPLSIVISRDSVLGGQTMILLDILRVKGRSVHTIDPDATLADVVRRLVEHNCGSLVICDEKGDMVGIITERDVLRACAKRIDTPLSEMSVRDHMTTNIVTAQPASNVNDVMGMLTDHRIRHLPVLEDGKLAGLISIGDVVKAQHDQLSMENHYLKNYIQS